MYFFHLWHLCSLSFYNVYTDLNDPHYLNLDYQSFVSKYQIHSTILSTSFWNYRNQIEPTLSSPYTTDSPTGIRHTRAYRSILSAPYYTILSRVPLYWAYRHCTSMVPVRSSTKMANLRRYTYSMKTNISYSNPWNQFSTNTHLNCANPKFKLNTNSQITS